MIPEGHYETTLRYFLRPVLEYLDNPEISEIMINGYGTVYVERQGRLEAADATFADPQQLEAAVVNIAQYSGRPSVGSEPRFDGRLPGGHRVHVVLPPLCRQGISVTIRKHSKSDWSLERLVKAKSLTTEAAAFLETCIKGHRNVIVSGGTGSGKTSLLNALSRAIPSGERILVIEDSSELQIQQDHVLSLESRPPDRKGRGAVTIRDLLHSSLRMRPDRIIIGECRGGEAFDLLQALNTGHAGSMSTVHANSAHEALNRLETLAMLSGVELPIRFLRAQVATAVHIVVQLLRFGGGRMVSQITANRGLDESGNYRTDELFRFRVGEGRLKAEPSLAEYQAELEASASAEGAENQR